MRAVFLAAFFAVFLVAFLAVVFRAVDFFAAVFLADFLAAFFAVRLVVALRAVDFFAAVFLADFLAAFLVALRAVDFLAAFFAVFLADFFAVRAVVVFRDELAAAWVSFGVTSSSVAGTRASCSRTSHPMVDVFTAKDRIMRRLLPAFRRTYFLRVTTTRASHCVATTVENAVAA